MEAAARAASGAAKRDDAGGRQGGGYGFAFEGGDGGAVELEHDGTADGSDGSMGEAHSVVLIVARMRAKGRAIAEWTALVAE
jgi:hypothetical protein